MISAPGQCLQITLCRDEILKHSTKPHTVTEFSITKHWPQSLAE